MRFGQLGPALRQLLHYVVGICNVVTKVAAVVGGACIVAMALLIAADVVTRRLGAPIQGTEQLSTYMFVGVALLGTGYSIRAGKMARVPIVLHRLPRKLRTGTTSGVCLLAAGVGASTLPPLLQSVQVAQVSGATSSQVYAVPEYLVYCIPLAGMAVLTLQLVGTAVSYWAGQEGGLPL